MVQLFGSRRRAFLAGVVLSVAVVLGGGYAYGAITSTNNQYTGCLAGGQLSYIAIGASPLKTCQKQATQISWNQTGPPGVDGTNGLDGVSVSSATEPAGANCANGGSKFTAADGVTYACNGAPGAKGDIGPPGPQGEPGNSGSIDQIACSTEAGIDPNGTIAATVAMDGTGQLSLKCVSTNPKLQIAIDLHTVCTILGCAQVPVGSVIQVDAAGDPISGGLQCPTSSSFGGACVTQRFAQGATVHFSSTSGTTFVGCDSIAAGICTYTVTGDHVIELTAT